MLIGDTLVVLKSFQNAVNLLIQGSYDRVHSSKTQRNAGSSTPNNNQQKKFTELGIQHELV